MLRIANHGPLIVRTNYWETELAMAGKLYVSIKAGAFRILLPQAHESSLEDMRAAREIVISRGPWPAARLDDAIEILFDDRSEYPYSMHLSPESFDRLPLDSDAAGEWVCSVWTAPRRGYPHKALERIAYYRRVSRLPCLKGIGGRDG